nr:hypothetical protein [Tanacetum cinerariifolium]
GSRGCSGSVAYPVAWRNLGCGPGLPELRHRHHRERQWQYVGHPDVQPGQATGRFR